MLGSHMQQVRGSNPGLGGLRARQFQASGGIGTLQSRASGRAFHPVQSNSSELWEGWVVVIPFFEMLQFDNYSGTNPVNFRWILVKLC